jgi:hypothetical protein
MTPAKKPSRPQRDMESAMSCHRSGGGASGTGGAMSGAGAWLGGSGSGAEPKRGTAGTLDAGGGSTARRCATLVALATFDGAVATDADGTTAGDVDSRTSASAGRSVRGVAVPADGLRRGIASGTEGAAMDVSSARPKRCAM